MLQHQYYTFTSTCHGKLLIALCPDGVKENITPFSTAHIFFEDI
jgi:hypothetical protein